MKGTYEVHYFIISAAWALFCLQCCRDLSMQLGILPVSSLEYWSEAMKPMQQKCWLYYSLGEILFVFNSRQSLLQRHKSSVAAREGQGREACCLCFSCTVYSQHCASRSPSSLSITSAQFTKILTSGFAVLWVSKSLFHHDPKTTKARVFLAVKPHVFALSKLDRINREPPWHQY